MLSVIWKWNITKTKCIHKLALCSKICYNKRVQAKKKEVGNADYDSEEESRGGATGVVAFTLAEVLITLAIIGVVAALTIPTLIMNYQKKATVVQLKKVYADLQNVVKLSEIDNGPMSEWDFITAYNSGDYYSQLKPFIEKYYLPYFKNAKLVRASEFDSDYFMLQSSNNGKPCRSAFITNFLILSNGTILSFFRNPEAGYFWLFVDINGTKAPNLVGRDIFVFDIYKYDVTRPVPKYKVKFWTDPYNDRIPNLKTKGAYACNKDNTNDYRNFYCGRLIQLNNWVIPDDYPW